MKKVIILLVLLVHVFQVSLKASPFGTSPGEYVTYPPSTLTTATLRVAVYVINRDDGSGGLTSQQVTNAINRLKQDFAPTNIFFVIVEISAINDDDCFYETVPVSWYALHDEGHNDNAINVYLGPMGVGSGGIASSGQTWYSPGNFLFVHGEYITKATLAHEMGHCLGLFHTHYGRGHDAGSGCEEAIDGSNCDTCGDLVCDTPADPDLYYYSANCEYYGPPEFTPDTKNIMSYADPDCKDHFTQGQVDRMLSIIEYHQDLQPVVVTNIVSLDQRRESGTRLNGTSIGRWAGTLFKYFTIQDQPVLLPMEIGTSEILKADQNRVTNPDEKYNSWSNRIEILQDVTNQHTFIIDQNSSSLTSHFKKVYSSITLKNEFVDNPGYNPANDKIGFKDPWLIDYYESGFGANFRNRGMKETGDDALIFRERLSPFNPDFTSTYEYGAKYNGVFLNENPQFDPILPIYTIRAPQTVDFGGNIGVRPVYFVNWSYDANKATLQYPNAGETPVVFKTSDAVITANLKASLISSSSSAYSNSSQRKFVRTQDGWLHAVYESGGHIWLEHSIDGGNTWMLGNNGQPLDNGGGKSPSISYNLPPSSYYSIVLVAFQEGSDIRVRSFAWDGNSSYINGPQDWIPSGESPSASLSPNIAFGNDGVFMVVWKKSSGIAYMLGILSGLCIGHAGNSQGIISGTNGSSYNPAISTDLLDPGYFDVAWQQQGTPVNGPPPVSIKACMLVFNGGYDCQYGYSGSVIQYNPPQPTISSSTMKINSNPSIISLPDESMISWIADYSGYYTHSQTKAVLRNVWGTPSYHVYDAYCKSTSINKKDDNSGYYFAYSYMPDIEGWSKYDLVVSSVNLSVAKGVSTNGPHLQLCNGPNKENIYVMAYYPYTVPYYFKKSNSLESAGLSKSVAFLTSSSRGVIIENRNAGLYYSFGQITANGNPVNFTPISNDATQLGQNRPTRMERIKNGNNFNLISTDTLNTYLISEPFAINGNSEIMFGDKFEISDSTASKIVLGEKEYVSFKVDLIDDIDGAVIGTIKESKCFRNTLPSCQSSFYKLANSRLGDKRVRIKITVSTNIKEPVFSIVDEHINSDLEEGIAKSSIKELSLSNLVTIDEYALHQAYPNPFNPTTNITYQVPDDGHVTLRIYDTRSGSANAD